MSRLVLGKGPTPARLMVVGEAPGVTEDELGEPFVGRSGQLLNRALHQAGLSRAEAFITNAYKMRPPGNRRPTPWELIDHMELLAEELHKVQPSFVLLLGNTALSVMGPAFIRNISKARGFNLTPHLDHATYATFHPSAGLRNPVWKQAIFDDVLSLAELMDVSTKVVHQPQP